MLGKLFFLLGTRRRYPKPQCLKTTSYIVFEIKRKVYVTTYDKLQSDIKTLQDEKFIKGENQISSEWNVILQSSNSDS